MSLRRRRHGRQRGSQRQTGSSGDEDLPGMRLHGRGQLHNTRARHNAVANRRATRVEVAAVSEHVAHLPAPPPSERE
jgi:hypothetical protein